jgi:hypothetical protein
MGRLPRGWPWGDCPGETAPGRWPWGRLVHGGQVQAKVVSCEPPLPFSPDTVIRSRMAQAIMITASRFWYRWYTPAA